MFLIGLFGIFLNKNNILIIILCLELILLSINSVFILSSVYVDDLFGQLMTLYVLVVASAESCLGLAIILNVFKTQGTLSIQYITTLRG
jgi:NADH-quinone oxidoreductase subunit K